VTRAESHSATQCDGVRITGHDGLGRRLSTIPIGRRARRYDGSTDVNDDRTFRDKGVRFGIGRYGGSSRSAARRDQHQENVSGMENFERRVAVQFPVFPLHVFGCELGTVTCVSVPAA
jgi:hypothetical protein